MKLSTLTGLALAGALAMGTAAPAMAQSPSFEPYYVTPKILYSHTSMDNLNTSGKASGYFGKNTGKYTKGVFSDDTFGGGLSVGYDFGVYSEYPIRMELEYLHRGKISGSGPFKITSSHQNPLRPQDTNVSGSDLKVSATVQTVMANFFLDFPTDTAFTPYVGLGIGGAYVDAKLSSEHTMTLGTERGYYVDDFNPAAGPPPAVGYLYNYSGSIHGQQAGWNFAWQASAGCSYQFKDNMSLDLSYRYSDFGRAQFGSSGFILGGKRMDQEWREDNTGSGGTDSGQDGTNAYGVMGHYRSKGKMDLTAHEVVLGLRITAF